MLKRHVHFQNDPAKLIYNLDVKIREIHTKTILNKCKISGLDFSLNPYIGCEHGCIYCYASYMAERFSHREKWGEFVDVKINAPELLQKKLKGMRKKKGTIGIGISTDPYQPVEKKYRITRKLLEVLRETDFRISMLTKSPLIMEDFQLISSFGERFRLGVSISIMTSKLKEFLEPRTSAPIIRLKALSKFSSINTFVFLSPLIPGFSDSERELELFFKYICRYGIKDVLVDRMSLYSNVRTTFLERVKYTHPLSYKRLLEYQKDRVYYLNNAKKRIVEISTAYGITTHFTF